MHRDRIRVRYWIVAAALTALTACGGGGGGGGVAGLPGGGDGNGTPGDTALFTATALQTLAGSTFSVAAGINGLDEVVGISNGAATPLTFKAALWRVTAAGGAAASEVTLLAMPPGAGAYSAANAINDSGVIVGEVESTPGGPVAAVLWPSRTATSAEVVLLPQMGASRSAAYGINSAGRIVGELDSGTDSFAVLWPDRTTAPVILPTIAGQRDAAAFFINDLGEVVGELADDREIHAVLWRPDAAGAYTNMPLLLPLAGALVGGDCTALAINAAGDIAGEVTDPTGKLHAVRWIRGADGSYTVTDLGAAPAGSSASGINDGGRIVGHVQAAADGAATAQTWAAGSDAGVVLDPTLGESRAFAIDAAGRVVGRSGNQAFIALPQ
jgi:uncharacterized membrane protein